MEGEGRERERQGKEGGKRGEDEESGSRVVGKERWNPKGRFTQIKYYPVIPCFTDSVR